MTWTQKYRPETLDDFAGQNKQLDKLEQWFGNWSPGDKGLLIHGPPGVGKTSSVHVMTEEKDLDLFEVNASDDRSRQKIEDIVGSASQQQSLFGKRKLILIDEVDGLSGRKDRGGVGAIINLLEETSFPIVMTANDPYASKLSSLRRKVDLLDFGKVHLSSMAAYLSNICEKEGIEADRKLLKQIARQNSGDLRASINDLEAVARGKDKLEEKDLELLGYRNREEEIFEVLKVVFKTMTAKTASNMLNNTEKDPDEIFWWIEENVPNEYKKSGEVAKAFEELSVADLFRARVRRRQNWGLKKYMSDIMSAGVALSKDGRYKSFTKYSPPQRLKRYGRSKGKRNKMDAIHSKMGQYLHTSSSKMKLEYFPLLKILLQNDGNSRDWLKERFDMTDKEIEVIEEF